MLPHEGQGGSQSMEDGYCLARCLSAYFHQNTNSLEHFLRIYEQCRLPRTTAVQASSREAGKLYEQHHAEMRGIVNEEEGIESWVRRLKAECVGCGNTIWMPKLRKLLCYRQSSNTITRFRF